MKNHPLIRSLPIFNRGYIIQYFLPVDNTRDHKKEQHSVSDQSIAEHKVHDDRAEDQNPGHESDRFSVHDRGRALIFQPQHSSAHHVVTDRVENVAEQRSVAGRDISEHSDEDVVQDDVGRRRYEGGLHQERRPLKVELRERQQRVQENKVHAGRDGRDDVYGVCIF